MELEQDIYALCQKLVETCAAKGLTVSTAESCTAGLVAAHIADARKHPLVSKAAPLRQMRRSKRF